MKKIQLNGHRGGEIKGYALVDDDYFEWLSSRLWSLSNVGYAVSSKQDDNGKWKLLYMHRIILRADKGWECDHVNGNKLDNRRINLRLCKHYQNLRNQKIHSNNTSGYKGVAFHKLANKWMASIVVNGENNYLGLFNTKEAAALAYNKASIELHGEYANPNILPPSPL